MVSRLRSTVVVCAVLIGGGAMGDWGSAGTASGEAALRAGPILRAAIDVAPVPPLLARRSRVKRRRVWGAVLPQPRLSASGPHRSLRSPAVDRLRGGRARARALVSDGAARGRLPAARSARLGRASTWCTSVPPPAARPIRSA